jgi:hypothetical protein
MARAGLEWPEDVAEEARPGKVANGDPAKS